MLDGLTTQPNEAQPGYLAALNDLRCVDFDWVAEQLPARLSDLGGAADLSLRQVVLLGALQGAASILADASDATLSPDGGGGWAVFIDVAEGEGEAGVRLPLNTLLSAITANSDFYEPDDIAALVDILRQHAEQLIGKGAAA